MTVADDLDVVGGDKGDRQGGFLGLLFGPRTLGAVFYMLLSLPLGVIYFTTVVTGLSVSIPMLILIVGLLIAPLFMLLVRFFSLTEGYITQTLLGAQIPVREDDNSDEIIADDEGGNVASGFWAWFKRSFSDVRSYTSMVYMLLMLPIGIGYFTAAVTGFAVSLAFIFAPIVKLAGLSDDMHIHVGDADSALIINSAEFLNSPAGSVLMVVAGLVGLVAMLLLSRGIGWLHARLAEVMLVKRSS